MYTYVYFEVTLVLLKTEFYLNSLLECDVLVPSASHSSWPTNQLISVDTKGLLIQVIND